MDTSTQKAFIPSLPGCLENWAKLSYALQDAKLQQKSIAICWLDLTNAFGSVDPIISSSFQP